jgi:glycine reductase
VVHYVNQFFGGIGGEEKANAPPEVRDGPVGPARLLQRLLSEEGSVVATLICGDNYFAEEQERALEIITMALQEAKPDVVVAGPAFDAGRYGLACGAVCQAAQEMGIPAVAAMHPENPGVLTHRRVVVIVPTEASPAEMQAILSQVLPIALKLGRGVALGPAKAEGYLPRGLRELAIRAEPGYKRAVDMLVKKLKGEDFQSEVPFQAPEAVPPAPPVVDLKRATIALITTGGLIPKGNPDRQTSGDPERYYTYRVDGLEALTGEDWETFHGGYYNQISSENPNYVLPLSFMRRFEAGGTVGGVHPQIFTMPGVATPVAKARRLGSQMAQELKDANIDGCILVAT